MDRLIKHKYYSPLCKETIEKAMREVNKERHELVNSIPLIADDELVVIYRETDNSIPPEEDMEKYGSGPEQQENYNGSKIHASIHSEESDWFSLAREYWFIVIPAAIFLVYVLGKYVF